MKEAQESSHGLGEPLLAATENDLQNSQCQENADSRDSCDAGRRLLVHCWEVFNKADVYFFDSVYSHEVE